MTPSWTVVVSATVSVVAALIAYWSAREAKTSSDNIDRRHHLIEQHDALAKTFQDAYADFVRAMALRDKSVHSAGELLAFAEVLAVHPLTTEALADDVDAVATMAVQLATAGQPPHGLDETMARVRVQVRDILRHVADERSKLLR